MLRLSQWHTYSYMNTCATAIVGTWVERLNVCRTESASMCRSLFGTEPVKNVNNQNAQENYRTQYRTVIQQLETICYITKNVHLIIRTINFLFSLKHDPISTYQSWNQFSSLFENLICVDRKNLFTNTNC